MDQHIVELFEKAQSFDEGELAEMPEYDKALEANLGIEYTIERLYGTEGHKLLLKFLNTYYKMERFHSLHYFCQGYLAAKAELEEKEPDLDGKAELHT